jgi:hypothetical protein
LRAIALRNTYRVCGTFRRVDQQQHSVDHGERALDLPAEVGVPRRVHEVDRDPMPDDRCRFRQDRDALFALQIEGVHVVGRFVAHDSGLAKHGFDQRRLAVVDVGDQGDVTQAFLLGSSHGYDHGSGSEDLPQRGVDFGGARSS